MEEQAEKQSENNAKGGEHKRHCPICGARLWLSNKMTIPDRRSTMALTMC